MVHTARIRNSFESLLSYLVAVYLSAFTWAFSYIHDEIESILDTVREKTLGHVWMIFIRPFST